MATTKKTKSQTFETPPGAVFFRHSSGTLVLSQIGVHAATLERLAVSFQVGNPKLVRRDLLDVADALRHLSRYYMGAEGYVETTSTNDQGPRHRVIRHPVTSKTLRVIEGNAGSLERDDD